MDSSQCGKTFSDLKEFRVVGHKRLDEASALLALKLIVEGNSVRSGPESRDCIATPSCA
jgi:hypothetical protein